MDNCIPSSQWRTASPWVLKTTTTINVAEITQVLTKGKQLLADLAIAGGYASLYHLDDNGKYIRVLLYLYLYAIESWDTTAQAMNFFDQNHLIGLLSKVEQLFYICTVNKIC